MNTSSDDSAIRELFQSLKRADEHSAPRFDDVLVETPLPARQLGPTVRWAIAGCAAALLVAFLFVRSQPDRPSTATTSPETNGSGSAVPIVASHRQHASGNPAETQVEFDLLRRSIADFFSGSPTQPSVEVRIWTSRTESLLALNLELPLPQE